MSCGSILFQTSFGGNFVHLCFIWGWGGVDEPISFRRFCAVRRRCTRAIALNSFGGTQAVCNTLPLSAGDGVCSGLFKAVL